MSDDENDKIVCKYGAKCYQKNPEHLAKYKHPAKRSRSPEYNSNKKPKTTSTANKHDSSPEPPEEAQSIENKDILTKEKELIKKYFLVDMPSDFYDFWFFCEEISKGKPKKALDSLGLLLVGPFDILSGCEKDVEDEKHLLHWRYYFDPPEFQTVIKGDNKSEHHMGYFRDSPDELPAFVAENSANNDCIIKPLGENLFAAINTYIDHLLPKSDPFKKMPILKLQKLLKEKAKELNYDLKKSTPSMEKRNRLSVCKSFHSAGIVVPYNKKSTVGYRPLAVSNKELVKICDKIAKSSTENMAKAMSELQPVITMATIAVDECDFGTALELGIDLFCYGNDNLNSSALRLLKSAYSVLDRDAFAQIAEAHLKNRKKGKPCIVNYS